MRHPVLTAAAFTAALAVPSLASAQYPGPPVYESPNFARGLIVGADRLWGAGFTRISATSSSGGVESSVSTTSTDVRLLYSGTVIAPSSGPRLAADFGLGRGLTVGGAFGYSRVSLPTVSSSCSTINGVENCTDTTKDASAYNVLGISPRAGLLLNLGQRLHLWPRAGLTLAHSWTSGGDGNNPDPVTTLGVNLEGMALFTPNANFGFSLGPVLDFTPFSSANKDGRSSTELYLGLASGIVGKF